MYRTNTVRSTVAQATLAARKAVAYLSANIVRGVSLTAALLLFISLVGLLFVSLVGPAPVAAAPLSLMSPVADAGGPYSGDRTETVTLDGSGTSDTDGNIVTYQWKIDGTEVYSGSNATYDLSLAGYGLGDHGVHLDVWDNDGLKDGDSTTLTVTNAPPTADADGPYSGDPTGTVTLDGSGSSDPDGTIATYQWEVDDTQVYSGSNATYDLSLAGYVLGGHPVTLTVSDDGGSTATDTTTLTVTNAPPTAADDAATTGEGTSVVIDLVANDSDSDGAIDPATVVVASGPSDGAVQVAASGAVTYTPDSGFYGSDSFTYTVDDDVGTTSNQATVTVDVEPRPIVASLDPWSVTVRDPGFTLTLSGQHFTTDSSVHWDGEARATTFVSSTELGAWIGPADLDAVDAAVPVTVVNPYVTSDPAYFDVDPPTLWLEPADGWVVEGDTVVVDVRTTVNDLYGVEFDLDFDPTLLEVVDADAAASGVQVSEGAMWSGRDHTVVQNDVSGGAVELGLYLQNPEDPVFVEDGQLAQVEFYASEAGVSDLDLNDPILSTIDGQAIQPVTLDDGQLTVYESTCVDGEVALQGRSQDWDGAQVTVFGGRGGSYTTDVSGADGAWQICGIVDDVYDVAVEMPLYLDALKPNVSVVSADLGQVQLLAGDCDDSDGDQVGPPYGVDISDAAIVGSAFNSSPPSDGRADLNDDAAVNILDAALLGGNWHKSSPVAW